MAPGTVRPPGRGPGAGPQRPAQDPGGANPDDAARQPRRPGRAGVFDARHGRHSMARLRARQQASTSTRMEPESSGTAACTSSCVSTMGSAIGRSRSPSTSPAPRRTHSPSGKALASRQGEAGGYRRGVVSWTPGFALRRVSRRAEAQPALRGIQARARQSARRLAANHPVEAEVLSTQGRLLRRTPRFPARPGDDRHPGRTPRPAHHAVVLADEERLTVELLLGAPVSVEVNGQLVRPRQRQRPI